MSDPKGFLKFHREGPRYRPVDVRIKDWKELYQPISTEVLQNQGARCMDCGVPFCQGPTGCPVENNIPDFNDMVYHGRWKDALKVLHSTNNFPEFTGRLCPAPCESACVLGIVNDPVSIKVIEWNIIDRGFREGWVRPVIPRVETGKKVAIVGSGPAGLAAAQQLRRSGHSVTVFEKSDRIGGLLRYGIPDFKMEKKILEQRLDQMRVEGVEFKTNSHIGKDIQTKQLLGSYDAICLAGGAEVARELPIPGRDLEGIHQAMDFLIPQNKINAGDQIPEKELISAQGKRVVIIGGGDTGSDCLGTCHRHGAKEVYQFELLSQPPELRAGSTPWPFWPMMLRTSHAHDEGGKREWSVLTKQFSGKNGRVEKLHAVRVEMKKEDGRVKFEEIPGTEFEINADLVILAMGFVGAIREGILADLGVRLDPRGNVSVDTDFMTSVEGVFAAGDIKRGASLIVWAIREGRDAARGMDQFLRAGRSSRKGLN